MTEKKKTLKILFRYHTANKINNNNGGGAEKRKKKKLKRIYRTSQNIRIIIVFLESLLSESFPLLGVTVHLTSLGCPPTLCCSLDLLWGQLRFKSGPVRSYLQLPQLLETSVFSFVGALKDLLYIPDTVCLVDCVDLICSLYSWWEGLRSSLVAQMIKRLPAMRETWVRFLGREDRLEKG